MPGEILGDFTETLHRIESGRFSVHQSVHLFGLL